MDKIKRVYVSLAMALVLFFGGVFSFLGVKKIKANALSDDYFGQANVVYYFSDYYPTFPNTVLSPSFPEGSLIYDVQRIDESDFSSMINANYFSGFGANCTLILDIKTFVLENSTLSGLCSSLKANYGCKIVLITTSLSSSELDTSELEDCVDMFYDTDFSKLEIFTQEIIAAQMRYDIGNGRLDGTTFLIDNILDEPADYAGMGLDYLCENSPFFDYFITELLDNIQPDASLEYSDTESMLTAMGIRIWHHTVNGAFMDMLTGNTVASLPEDVVNNFVDLFPTATCDYVTIGFSSLSLYVSNMIKSFQLRAVGLGRVQSKSEANMLSPLHILEAQKITYGDDIAAFIAGGDIDDEEFLSELEDLWASME